MLLFGIWTPNPHTMYAMTSILSIFMVHVKEIYNLIGKWSLHILNIDHSMFLINNYDFLLNGLLHALTLQTFYTSL